MALVLDLNARDVECSACGEQFTMPRVGVCDAKGIVSVSRAAHWVKCQEART